MIGNPFITYGYESADYFCDRVAETQQLTMLLRNGNHVALISPRRMGKTGLLWLPLTSQTPKPSERRCTGTSHKDCCLHKGGDQHLTPRLDVSLCGSAPSNTALSTEKRPGEGGAKLRGKAAEEIAHPLWPA